MPVPEYGSAEFKSWTADGTSTSSSAAASIVETTSGSLPFGKNIPLSTISGPTYVTAQLLVQQVAYLLSDKIWSYSPESFDLDIAASSWSKGQDANLHGYTPKVQSMDIRSGAGSAALGYLFSKDFNIKRRHVPQAILASSSALSFLRQALDQLSLLYGVTNPFVAHVAAATYEGKQGVLSADYISSMWLAEDLGYNLICSHSAHESQHMSLLATLLAQDAPVLHTYDGIHMSRDTTRVIDVLDKSGLKAVYKSVLDTISSHEHKHSTIEGKTLRTIKAVNDELGTDYKPFEYFGHSAAETVLVTFGSVESSLSAQVAAALANHGSKVGVVNVRVYRPFIEESFLQTLPRTTKVIGVLGQVSNAQEVSESGIRSRLFEDVLAAVAFTTVLPSTPEVRDIKASRSEVWSPKSIAAIYHMLAGQPLDRLPQETLSPVLFQNDVRQYSFWNVDDSPSAAVAAGYLAQALAKDSSQNVTVNDTYDNLVQGGVHRIDIRKSPKTLDATYPILEGDVAVVTDAALLDKVNVLSSIKNAGKLILLLPGIKDEDVEKKISPNARRAIARRDIDLYLIDVDRSTLEKESSDLSSLVLQVAFLRVALGKSEDIGISKLAAVGESAASLEQAAEDLEKTLRQIEVPKEWSEAEVDEAKPSTVTALVPNSFSAWDKSELEAPSLLESWQKAAKGLLFKEAYNTQDLLRPDLPTKTFTVHVKENRRLTPLTYDRNIFHIEFDLGTSGLNYAIGEALGIHAENNPDQVLDFIKSYKLDANALVEVPSREDPDVLEIRTIYQALIQNIDIFGRPPKKFYESLAEFATDATEEKNLRTLAGPEGFKEFQRRAEVDTVTFADILLEFPSAHPSFHDLVNIVSPMKRREYSIASCQAVTPTSVALMVVVVNWVDPLGRDRFGQATHYLSKLRVGTPVTVSVKPSVMKLPTSSTSPIIMAGLGTGLAPFRAFVQHRALEKSQGKDIGSVLLYMGSRHQREEYCYGEEWEAYQAAGVITLLGRAFSRDQPQKIYIQDRMRQTLDEIRKAYLKDGGSFYLCGPTWPVPDVTNVLEEAIAQEWKAGGKTVKRGDTSKEIMKLKDDGRYVLEVY